MLYIASNHALEEMERRGIPLPVVDFVLHVPEQKVRERAGITCFQSRMRTGGKIYLIRVMVDEAASPPRVVTVYRTRKIDKYWREEP